MKSSYLPWCHATLLQDTSRLVALSHVMWQLVQFMWLGSRQQLAMIETQYIQIGEHRIKFSTSAKNLGVIFDPELGMDLHVNNITRSCFFQLRQLRSIRRSLTMEASKTLVHSLVSSRVDYCNSIFYGAANTVLRRLQSVVNAAARLIANTRKFDHITPVLRDQLHWLPIRQRIIFKIATFVQNSLHGRGPSYLSRSCMMLHPHLGNRCQSPPSIGCAKTLFHTSNQDSSLRAKKLPCLRTGCVELSARRHYKSRTDTGTIQDWIENSRVSWDIRMPSSAHSAYVTWLGALNKCVVHLHLHSYICLVTSRNVSSRWRMASYRVE